MGVNQKFTKASVSTKLGQDIGWAIFMGSEVCGDDSRSDCGLMGLADPAVQVLTS